MVRGKGPKPYKFQEWPKMFYHPETGDPGVFRKASMVPDGYVDHISKVGKTEEDLEADKQAVIDADVAAQRLLDDAAADELKAQKADDKAAKVIFKKLKTTRDEAEAMLDEDNIVLDADADDLAIAMALQELLEDDDSE
jgi:hypothetical protein